MKKKQPKRNLIKEPYRQIITSADLNLRLETFELTPSTIKFHGPRGWCVKKWTLHGGKQEGVDLIEINNGTMRVVICPTRGMGVIGAEFGDIRLGWDSPVKEIVHPCFINLLGRGGLGWLEGFNEWIVRCGLENAGAPGKDKFINNVGDEGEMDLTLHGRIANIPASEVEVIIERQEPYTIKVVGRVFERMFYGPKLELLTEISTTPESNKLTVSDSVINHGGTNQEFQLLYHINLGSPILEKGTRFVAPIRTVAPINQRAAVDVENYNIYPAPTPGFIERVYCLIPYADKNGETMAMLRNANGTRALLIRYSSGELPYLTLWKSTNIPEEGYVTGIEPATGFPYNRRIERKFGRVPVLAPKQARNFTIHYEVLADAESVRKCENEIDKIQGERETTIIKEPPKVE
ncbi:MAG: aldose 1-epimerase family protein [Verrucomicrobiia bacterium]